ncbi:hypothetical protein [Clostridium chromiireducens]|nr:hypothetical protein [Clostridium chromiireducens]
MAYFTDDEPTNTLFWTTLLLYLAAPLFSDLVSVISMEFYRIDHGAYKEICDNKTDESVENGKELKSENV